MKKLLCGSLLLWSFLALADDARFTKARSGAEALSGLGPFLEKFVGECSGAPPGSDCKAAAASFRQKASGKRYYMIVGDEEAIIAPGAADEGRNEMTLNVTPFFPANSYALTQGAPKKTDSNGNPVMPLLYVPVHPPDGMNTGSLARMVGMRGLKLEVVFTPQDLWALPKKGGGKNYGVRARIDAVRVTVARTGEELGVWSGR